MKYIEKKLEKEIYRNIQKRKQSKINNELKKLRLYNFASRNNITQADLEKIKHFNSLNLKTLQKIAQQRGINTTTLKKRDLIYTLIRSEPSHKENKYFEYIDRDTNKKIHNKINHIRLRLVDTSPYLNKEELNQIRKELYVIEKSTKANRSEKTKLLNRLHKISTSLVFKKKNMINEYRDDNYANIQDIEYMFNDLDDYYKPILAQGLFNDNYQRYYCRGDQTRQMSIDEYKDKVIPYLKILIDQKKIDEQKIQLDMGINPVHITDNKRITFYTKSENIKCLPLSNTDDILNKLLTSFYRNYQEDMQLCRTSSNFVYESVEELNIHFYKVDLQRGASYIPTSDWLKNKKATINPNNT